MCEDFCCSKQRVCVSCSVMSESSQLRGLEPARLLCPRHSPGKNIGEGCHALLQGIFPTQGSNPFLLHCSPSLYHLNHQRGSVTVSSDCLVAAQTCLDSSTWSSSSNARPQSSPFRLRPTAGRVRQNLLTPSPLQPAGFTSSPEGGACGPACLPLPVPVGRSCFGATPASFDSRLLGSLAPSLPLCTTPDGVLCRTLAEFRPLDPGAQSPPSRLFRNLHAQHQGPSSLGRPHGHCSWLWSLLGLLVAAPWFSFGEHSVTQTAQDLAN